MPKNELTVVFAFIYRFYVGFSVKWSKVKNGIVIIFHRQPLICQSFGSQVIDQNALSQSDCRLI